VANEATLDYRGEAVDGQRRFVGAENQHGEPLGRLNGQSGHLQADLGKGNIVQLLIFRLA